MLLHTIVASTASHVLTRESYFMRFVKLTCATLALCGILLTMGLSSHAQILTYVFSATGTGGLGPSAFSNAPFTITAKADTSSVTSVGNVFFLNTLSATVNVTGVGSGTFLEIPTTLFDNQDTSVVGISTTIFNRNVLSDTNSAFATYKLATSIGPVTGSPIFFQGEDFRTSAGFFGLISVGNVTFRAFTVPEPGSIALLTGLSVSGGLFAVSRLSRRRANR
jgi:hypothetical protein